MVDIRDGIGRLVVSGYDYNDPNDKRLEQREGKIKTKTEWFLVAVLSLVMFCVAAISVLGVIDSFNRNKAVIKKDGYYNGWYLKTKAHLAPRFIEKQSDGSFTTYSKFYPSIIIYDSVMVEETKRAYEHWKQTGH